MRNNTYVRQLCTPVTIKPWYFWPSMAIWAFYMIYLVITEGAWAVVAVLASGCIFGLLIEASDHFAPEASDEQERDDEHSAPLWFVIFWTFSTLLSAYVLISALIGALS